MIVVKLFSQLLAFLVELAMLAAFGYWGYHAVSGTLLRWLLMIVGPLLAIVIWGAWLAPNNTNRLHMPMLLIAKVILFGLGTAGLYLVGQKHAAFGFAGLCLLSFVLMFVTNDF